MHFNIGDQVIHPAHGMGRITRLIEKTVSDTAPRLYYEILLGQSTLWVPVDTPQADGLRALTPIADLPRCRTILLSKPDALNDNHRFRRQEVSTRLKLGAFTARCEVVRDLSAHGWRKTLNDTDAASLRHGLDTMSQEWAQAEGVTVEAARREITGLLHDAKVAFAA